jgi:hypothetical protein
VLFTCPSRYSSTIGHTGVFSLGGWSPQLHARTLVPGVTQELHLDEHLSFGYRALTVSGAPFQGTSPAVVHRSCGSYNPSPTRRLVWALARSLAATQAISTLISLPPGTEMFQFPGFAHSRKSVIGLPRPGCPIRPSGDHCVCATPPGLSQLTTAFLASVCPGIPHMPSLA